MDRPSTLQWLLFCISLGVFAFLASKAPTLVVSSGWTDHLEDSTPAVKSKQAVDAFLGGAKEYSQFFIYAQNRKITSNELLAAITYVTQEIEQSGLFEQGQIKAINYNRKLEFRDGFLDSSKYLQSEKLPLTDSEISALEDSIRRSSHLYGSLVAEDFRSARIIAVIERKSGDGVSGHAWRLSLAKEVEQRFGAHLAIIDDIFVNAELDFKAINDTVLWPGLAILVIMLVFYFTCGRSLYHAAGFLLLTGMSLASLFGLIALLGYAYHIIFVFIPILLVVSAGSDYPYFALRDHYASPRHILKQLWIPIILAAVTTSVSAGSLTIAQIDQIRQFGIIACAGILLNSVFSLTIIPIYFYLVGRISPQKRIKEKNNILSSYVVAAVSHLHERNSLQVIAVLGIAFLTIAAVPMALLVPWTDDYIYDYFNPGDQVVKSTQYADKNYGGFNHFKVVVKAEGGFAQYDNFLALAKLQQAIKEIDYSEPSTQEKLKRNLNLLLRRDNQSEFSGLVTLLATALKPLDRSSDMVVSDSTAVANTTSIVDLVSYVNQQLAETSKSTLPANEAIYSYILQNFMGETFHTYRDDLFSDNLDLVAIDVLLNSSDSRIHQTVYDDIVALGESFSDLEVNVGGHAMKWLIYKDHIVSTKISNIAVVFALVGLCCCITFSLLGRSLVHGIVCGITILLPVAIGIFWVMAVMFLFGIELNIATATISAIGIGVSVNFATHLVYALQSDEHATDWKRTVNCIFIDLLTSMGFLFLLGSSIKSVYLTGVFIVVSVLIAFFLTVILVPIVYRWVSPSHRHEPNTNEAMPYVQTLR